MKNLLIRTVSGLIYVAIVLAAILISDLTMLALTLLLAIPALKEYSLMMHQYKHSDVQTKVPEGKCFSLNIAALELCGLALILALWQLTNSMSGLMMGIFLLLLVGRMLMAIYSSDKSALSNLASDLGALLYIALPLGLLNCIYVENTHLVLALFLFIWLNDTGAFLFGSALGRHRLFPSVSPKKSWEGFFGGLAVVIAAAVALNIYLPEYFGYLPLAAFTAYAATVSIFATWGDLFESFIKRTAGVKDSGNIMPGHGGALDRIDSLLIVSLATTAFLLII